MDAHPVCPARLTRRGSSKVYQDLSTALSPSRDSTLGSPGMKPATSATHKRVPLSTRRPHVCIVGAGLSGLRCADILVQNGISVTLLEARGRLGGRVHQQRLSNGHLVDLGPNWIHGTDDNPILDLAKQTSTAVGSWDSKSWVFTALGQLLPLEEGERYTGMMWEIVQQAFEYSNSSGAGTPADKSLLDFFKERIPLMVPDTEPDFERKRGIMLDLAESWGAFVGSPVSGQSLKYFWLEECIEGENLFCAGTYKYILRHIAGPSLKFANIKLNCVVTRICYTAGATPGMVEVEVHDGSRMTFDEVVVTTPLGWLKRNLGAFSPALPSRLTQAINSIGYGCLEKVYITFPYAFWLDPSLPEPLNGFIEWLTPGYAAETNPQRWHQEAVELASLPGRDAHPTLLFYTFGQQSKHVTTALAELSTDKEKAEFLQSFFHPYYSRLPNFDAGSQDCRPLEFLATQWSNDELAGRGSYCNFQVGLEDGEKAIETMREGLPEQRLWLAGEHTAPFVALGTATGAYWSGEMVGKRIAEAYKDEPTPQDA